MADCVGCDGDCKSSCKGSCINGCSGSCGSGRCGNSCINGCINLCTDNCTGSCGGISICNMGIVCGNCNSRCISIGCYDGSCGTNTLKLKSKKINRWTGWY
jgi:hypothetical protein